MKKLLFILVLGITVFAVARPHSFAFNVSLNNTETQSLGRPYLVEVVETNGEISKEYRGVSNNSSPYSIAEDLGAGPYSEDRFKAFPDIDMSIGSKITLYRAPVIQIKDGKRSKTLRSWQKTVGELFTEQKIEIGKDDRVNFSDDTAVEDGIEIIIIRVSVTTVLEKETIKFTTVKKPNSEVEKGNKKTLQAGKNGIRNKYYLVRREDGEEVSRKLTKTEIAEEPIEEILEVGTKVIVFGSGKASWYGWPAMEKKNAFYAASKTLPKGTEVWVVNTANGKGIKVTILDRVSADVLIDLSPKAFSAIGSLGAGIINVRVEKYYPDE